MGRAILSGPAPRSLKIRSRNAGRVLPSPRRAGGGPVDSLRGPPRRPARPRGAPPRRSPHPERALTADGAERFRDDVRALRAAGVRLARALTSPWRRAAETAALLEPLLEGPVEPTALLARAPGPELLARLAALEEAGAVAAVGHEPWCSELAAALVGAPALADRLRFAKGAALHLEGEAREGGMRVVALWPPKPLARLAGRLRG